MSSIFQPGNVAGIDDHGERKYFMWWCPGCEALEGVEVGNVRKEHVWSFNNDLKRPSLHPSVLVRGVGAEERHRCHCWIKDGQIEFLADCTHELAGKTVPMTLPPED